MAGNGFYVVTFKDDGMGGKRWQPMVAVLFREWGNCAVFNREMIGQGEITFGINSWRGDNYEGELRKAIQDETGYAFPELETNTVSTTMTKGETN